MGHALTGLVDRCGVVGGWLLFAGPVYQAALELREEEGVHRDEILAEAGDVPPPPRCPRGGGM